MSARAAMATNKDASWFRPFFNLDKDGIEYPYPHGLIEKGMPARVVRTILDLRREFSSRRGLWYCAEIAPAWAARLKTHHPRMRIEWDGDPGSDGPTSGYRVDERRIRPHVWVTVGPRQLIFDPTAYQFDASSDVELGYSKPGISLDRYRKDGSRFAALR